MITIYSLKTKRERTDWERQRALDILTPERKAKALRFRRSEDQIRGIATGLLEEYVLWKEFGVSPEALRLGMGEQGKPYLTDHPEAQYNLSHAGEWVVCAAGMQPLGIDIEQPERYSERLVQRFFQPDEITDILKRSEEDRANVFAEYWTMKESFMKLCGAGLSMGFSGFRTERMHGRIELLPALDPEYGRILEKMGMRDGAEPVCRFLDIAEGYVCAVCTIGVPQLKNETVTWETCVDGLEKLRDA